MKQSLWQEVAETEKLYESARLVSLVECVGLVGCRVTIFGGLGVVSYLQPPDRSQHGCTVGIDRDPPMWHPHPGRVVEVPERQLLRTSVLVRVLLHTPKTSSNSDMWEIRLKIANLVCSKMLHLQVTCEIQNKRQEGYCAYLDHMRVFEFHGCAKSKPQFLTQVYTWMVCQLFNLGVCAGNVIQ